MITQQRGLALMLVLMICSICSGGELTPEIRLDSGPVRGIVKDGMPVFLGIPYAAPPTGRLRWTPPQPAASWTTVRDCAAFGAACPQPKQDPAGNFSEDCLFLNVWTPELKEGANLPVMVWIHGGGYNFGSTTQAEYDGRNLASRGVVVVTVNYRLGPLGFLVHPLLSKESAQATSGNYGLLDQIAALRWVQRNIRAFGGNPGNVTLFGQSAGSRSVALLTLSSQAKGLFHRAITQSGGPIIGSEYLSPAFNGDMANVSRMGQALSSRMGCDKAADELGAMRKKTAQEVIAAADCRTGLFDDALFFAPVFDGVVLPRDPVAASVDGSGSLVPRIAGSTGDEGTVYLRNEKDLTLAKYSALLQSRFGEHAGEALRVFPAASDQEVPQAINRLITAGANAQPARFQAQAAERTGGHAYLYRFIRKPDTAKSRALGAFHGVDLAYMFGNMNVADGYTELDRNLSAQMMSYWVNFAKTGNPNGPGLPEWPVWRYATDRSLCFGDDIHAEQNLYKEECDFLQRVSQFHLKSMLPDSGTGKTGGEAPSSSSEAKHPEKELDPHASRNGVFFKDSAMDFVFGSLALGAAVNGGCEIGEAYVTASQIKDGDADSWRDQWLKLALRLEERGNRSLAAGHTISAREQFMRASYAYRLALVSMLPDDPQMRPTARHSRELMKKAGKLMSPELEYIEIPFDGAVLPGYFRKAENGPTPAKTLIMVGGAETFAEDQYFYIAPQANARGYHFLTVDLPGQGLLPLEGKCFRPDMDVQLKAVLDYALTRPEADAQRIAVYGISSGGGFVPMAAVREKRIAAVVMNNSVVDAGAGVAKMSVAKATPDIVKTWTPFQQHSNKLVAWRFGVAMDNLPGLVAANEPFQYDPAKLTMPALVLVSGGEYKNPEIVRQTEITMKDLPNPARKLVVAPADEGATNHCIMENRNLMSQVVFDWLDTVLQ